jgi:DNA-binding response OmpR family regulator
MKHHAADLPLEVLQQFRVIYGTMRQYFRTIDVHIRRLRKVLEPYAADRFVQTVRGTGYRFSTRADIALG